MKNKKSCNNNLVCLKGRRYLLMLLAIIHQVYHMLHIFQPRNSKNNLKFNIIINQKK